ncbi:MAG: ribonuclease HII [Micrococcaceae bacterium]|nr:ribonuclease HII [Micrococcaceae bacterium]
MIQEPDLTVETTLSQTCGGSMIAGMDEVGRGALAGPVAVGVAAVDVAVSEPLVGLRDSKRLTALQRERMTLAIPAWATTAVGLASAEEIDTYGITAALGLAGRRAWHELVAAIDPPHGLVLDGNTQWLNDAPLALTQALAPVEAHIVLQTKADATCSTVSAAAITAKVARDALMVELAEQYPAYGWDGNKGYGSASHRAALVEVGVCEHHRRSWNLVPDDLQLRLL